jgi:hypothetical protein
MLKEFIEWTEKEKSRARKVVLFASIGVFLAVTIAIFGAAVYGVVMSDIITTLYITFVGLMSAIYGFFTGTSSDKSIDLADKAADIMIEKLGK